MVENAIRRRQRFHLSLPLWVRFRESRTKEKRPKEQPADSESTITENISTAGCYFLLNRKPSVGAKAHMEIPMPVSTAGLQTGKVRCHGRVIRVDDLVPGEKVGVACSIEGYKFSTSDGKRGRI